MKQAHHLASLCVEGTKLLYEWNPKDGEVGRVPYYFLHEDKKLEISYMRDGIILFSNGKSGTYERLMDTEECQRILVTI